MAISHTEAYLANICEIGISRPTLKNLLHLMQEHQNVALIGWNDYAKHLINLCPSQIDCIIDERPEVAGLSFREVPVVSFASDEAKGSASYLVTRFDMLTSSMVKLYQVGQFPKKQYRFALQYDGLPTAFYLPMMHDDVFKAIKGAGTPPPSMMEDDQLVLLVETLKTALRVDGDVVEVGCWQGGSAWYLGRVLGGGVGGRVRSLRRSAARGRR
ncbi:hypothetical protein [Jiella pelagia]|uniref:Uncharacterized protein n=1 Tax=Jiella pelagia TaxID=2986949 RepID=A0ABY7BZL3_9HYPH|nr:hypothetical protein [Jiella pelagia]WAP68852.1 hypothetical protein OH818_27130 [Jiella pelagia]